MRARTPQHWLQLAEDWEHHAAETENAALREYYQVNAQTCRDYASSTSGEDD